MERCYSPLDRRGRKDPETRSKRYFRSVTTERLQCYLLRMHRTQCHVKRDWPCDEQKEYREGLGLVMSRRNTEKVWVAVLFA